MLLGVWVRFRLTPHEGFPMRLHHVALSAVFCLHLTGVLSAATVYQVTTVGAETVGSKNNGGVYIGQAFNSGTNTQLTSASLEINRNGLTTGNFTVNLHLASGVPGAYLTAGSSLASTTLSNAVLSEDVQTFYTVSMNWALTPNTVYMIGIVGESTATVKWNLNQSTTKNSSTGFITGYDGYNAQAGSGVDNGLHGATITAVPEPSTAVLALAAGGCAWLMRRRTRPLHG